MGRPRKPYKLWRKATGIYYWAAPHSPRWKSTGLKNKSEAIRYILKQLQHQTQDAERQSLKDFLHPFYRWPNGPHVSRLLAEGKIIGCGHVEQTRRCLDRHVIPDLIAGMKVEEIRRSHLLDFRARLMAKSGPGSGKHSHVGVKDLL